MGGEKNKNEQRRLYKCITYFCSIYLLFGLFFFVCFFSIFRWRENKKHPAENTRNIWKIQKKKKKNLILKLFKRLTICFVLRIISSSIILSIFKNPNWPGSPALIVLCDDYKVFCYVFQVVQKADQNITYIRV